MVHYLWDSKKDADHDSLVTAAHYGLPASQLALPEGGQLQLLQLAPVPGIRHVAHNRTFHVASSDCPAGNRRHQKNDSFTNVTLWEAQRE